MVGLTTSVVIVALELVTPGFKVVSDWGVGLVLAIDVSGFKDVIGPSVMTLVEGFKVVSATVTDRVTGAVAIGVNDVSVSDCWLLLLVVVPSSGEASVEALIVIELGFEVLSVEGGSKVELELTRGSVVEETPPVTVVGFKDVCDGLVIVIGLVPSDWGFVDTGVFGDVLMGCWVVSWVDIIGSKVGLELTKGSVVEEIPPVTVVGFKDVCVWLTRDSVDVGTEAGVIGFTDVLGAFVDKRYTAVVVSMLVVAMLVVGILVVGMSDVLGALVDKIGSAVVVSRWTEVN